MDCRCASFTKYFKQLPTTDFGNRAPITAFTGLPAVNPLRTLILPEPLRVDSADFIKLQKLVNIERMIGALDDMHRDIVTRRSRKRKAGVAAHNARTHVQPINFEIGDHVLVAQRESKKGNKLQVKWRVPWRILRPI